MGTCSFCGRALEDSPRTYVERPDVDRLRTEIARACPECSTGFPVAFSVK
ncbi:MAG TPA: hypothetical protein VGR51_05985 [Thermoplasmata archaeon]|jgi:hypothetical protein|nr:hypothetical protein [Thermoplasmata archaeon]